MTKKMARELDGGPNARILKFKS